jgi:feruloyl esterase
MRTLNFVGAVALAVILGGCGETEKPPEPGGPVSSGQPEAVDRCASLQNAAPVHTTISHAGRVNAGAFVAPTPPPFGVEPDFGSLPAFCRVAGSIAPTPDSDIRFELWLPLEGWNGRFLQAGNGGAAGSLVYGSMILPLSRGYAVTHTDTGHRGGGGDFSWAIDHPERLVDYQYRAVHELTVAGKALTETYYGMAPQKSYWLGCSTGGRQGLKEAQRYPGDYDAVIAGAPANNWSPLMTWSIHVQRELMGAGALPAKLGMLREGAVAACDGTDGVVDGVITASESCSFDPVSLQCAAGDAPDCLTAEEVVAARRLYAGVVDGEGQVVMPGTGPGSEREWAAYLSEGFQIGSNYFKNVVTDDPEWSAARFEVDRDLALAEAFDAGAADAMDPDISAFVERGGRLMLYHGTTDGLISYRNTVNYYQSVVDALGEAADDHVKLFLVPGMDHCRGGSGVHQVDWLSAMEQWAERGDPPTNLTGLNPGSNGQAPFSRPICAFPEAPVYDGAGDTSQAGSYACRD